MPDDLAAFIPRTDALDDLLPLVPRATHPPGADVMLRLIAYDIASPKRWRHVCDTCEDYGVRVQYSLFECWLEEPRFEKLWARLKTEINAEEDALAAYVIDRSCSPRRRQAGKAMVLTQPRERFIL